MDLAAHCLVLQSIEGASPLWNLSCTFISSATPDAVKPLLYHEGSGLVTMNVGGTVLTISADPAMPVFGGLAYDHVIIEYTHAGV